MLFSRAMAPTSQFVVFLAVTALIFIGLGIMIETWDPKI
jgi:hypothetical protein